MDLSSNLNRTYHPKYTTYTGDGFGRDSYITTNNGGFLPQDKFITPQIGFTNKITPTQFFINQHT